MREFDVCRRITVWDGGRGLIFRPVGFNPQALIYIAAWQTFIIIYRDEVCARAEPFKALE
jgi:hypothetical protein